MKSSPEERRHIEMMAATIAAGYLAHGFSGSEGDSSWSVDKIHQRALHMAFDIQLEFAELEAARAKAATL